MKTQEQELNITINLDRGNFERRGGLFTTVAEGRLTDLISRFTQNASSQAEFLQMLVMTDDGGRTALDIACYQNFRNLIVYLLSKYGQPHQFIGNSLNVDSVGRNAYHMMMYKGNFDALVTMLNYERMCLRKVIFDELQALKLKYKFKNLDIKQGHLVSTVYHDEDTKKRHFDCNIRMTKTFEKYAHHIIERYREILLSQDRHMRNPLHYGAMSRFTQCFKSLKALLDIKIDFAPEYPFFEHLYFEIAALDRPDKTTPIDPRK